MAEDKKEVLSAIYERRGYHLTENIYKGEMLVLTHRGLHGLEKSVYIKDTFIKENYVHLEADSKDLALKYNAALLNELIKKNVIKRVDVESVISQMEKEEEQLQAYGEWLHRNPQASEEEKRKHLEKLTIQTVQEQHNVSFSIRRLLTRRDAILCYQNNDITSPLFRNHVDKKSDFAMTKPVAERLARLPTLLYTSTFSQLYDNFWKLSAKIIGRKPDEPPIELEYTFLATSPNEAEKLAEHYKEALKKGGLKVLLTYWKMANNMGKFIYSAPLREIMELTSGRNRDSYYNSEERKRFWAMTRLLERTKLSIPFVRKKGGKQKGKIIKAEHRLLEILNRSADEEDECPIEVRVRVIDQNVFEEQTQLATAIANNILALNENDILLGFSLEVRASQRREYLGATIDYDFLIDKGNLSSTAKSNPRMAKKKGREKLDRLRNAQVGITEWHETSGGKYEVKFKKRPTQQAKLQGQEENN